MKNSLSFAPDGTLYDPINDVDEKHFPSDGLDPLFPPPTFKQNRVVSVAELRDSPQNVEEITYLTIGGGVGSFIFVDNLIIRGVSPQDIVSIGMEDSPYGRYKRLCLQSQIPPEERLRSDSGSTPDNIWGWPGYAVREAWTDFRAGNVGHAARVLGKIFSEPIFTDSYTPISGRVYDSIDREAARIGWSSVMRCGRVLGIRMTNDDRYVTAYATRTQDGIYDYHYMVSDYLHVAVGYPAIRLLPDLQYYRQEVQDNVRVINSYEDHSAVYDELQQNGGVVVLRGRGIVSSRIIQRLYEVRQYNPNITLIHLMRQPLDEPSELDGNHRILEHNWEIQPYNFPKASWGGNIRQMVESTAPEDRPALISRLGGTTTSDRQDWRNIIDEGVNAGWYQIVFATVSDILEEDDGRISLLVRKKGQMIQSGITADYLIDATGLDAAISRQPLLADLVAMFDIPLNPMHRLHVAPTFEAQHMRNGKGRAYFTGASTLGSSFAPVDSFLGLQYAAQVSIEDMRRAGGPQIEQMDVFTSTLQWFRWAFNQPPHHAVKEATQ